MIKIVLIQILFSAYGKQTVYSFDADDTNQDYWVILNQPASPFTSCNGKKNLGGQNKFDMSNAIMRNFELPPHYRLYLDITYFRINWVAGNKIQVLLDDTVITDQSLGYQFLCSSVQSLSTSNLHSSSFGVVQIEVVDNSNTNLGNWGIRSFKLSVDLCPDGCSYCKLDQVVSCIQWSLQFWDKQSNGFTYFDYSLYQNQQFNQVCNYAIPLPQHDQVRISFRVLIQANLQILVSIDNTKQFSQIFTKTSDFQVYSEFSVQPFPHTENIIYIQIKRFDNGQFFLKDFQLLVQNARLTTPLILLGCSNIINQICLECDLGWILDQVNFICIPICGDSLIVGDEECDDGNNVPGDGCYQCQFKCDQVCDLCIFGQCIISQQNIEKITNFQLLEYQLAAKLNTCNDGWVFDYQSSICKPICGDQRIVGYEECDDGDNISDDACYQCKFTCTKNCELCKLGHCVKCTIGYYLDDNNECSPVCGDSIIQPYLEECDGLNTINGLICNNCQIDCCENCSQCQLGMCYICLEGFQLNNNQCLSICGDGIRVDNEMCDDGNDEQYDGCYECQYSCKKECFSCNGGICLDSCELGYLMINGICESICGNSIVTESEDCDDGNSIQYDGCFNCQFSCPQFCQYCYEGQCFECKDSYSLKNNTCEYIEICGNSIVGDKEECDDGNQIPNDGCYLCKFEQNWICDQNQCAFQIIPDMIVTYLNQTFSIQYVQITFSQEIYIDLDQPLSKTMSLIVINLAEELFNITVYPIREATANLSYAKYEVSIDINQLMNEKPVLQIDLKQQVYNQYEIPITSTQSAINLNYPKYLSAQDKDTAETLYNNNQNIMIGLGAISAISLIMGETAAFQEILRLMQYQSYLKFINIEYPENLYIFFESTNIVSVSPIIKYTNLNYYLNKLSLKQGPLPSNGKFALYNYDADLVTNLSCQILQFMGLIVVSFFIKIMQKLFYKRAFIQKYIDCIDIKKKSKIVLTLHSGIHSIIKGTFQSSTVLAKHGLRALLLVNGQDILFKAFLYLYSMHWNSVRNYVLASISLSIVATYFLFIFISLTKQNFLFSVTKAEQTQIKYDVITLVKQMGFLLLLVFFQNTQVLQVILISLTNIIYFLFLKKLSNMRTHFHLAQQTIEGIVILFTLSSFIYFDDLGTYFSQQTKIQVAWSHITILCLSLVAEISKFVFSAGKSLINYIKKKLANRKKIQKVSPHKLFHEIRLKKH